MMEDVEKHFDDEASEFDRLALKLIPFYPEMVEALVLAIPFERSKEISVIDLGCGTGTISKKIKERFPAADIVCLDFSVNMLAQAKKKLKDYSGIEYIKGDISEFDFPSEYDVVVSSLAIHHLVSNDDKNALFGKIFKCLNQNGVFYNADIILASNDYNQRLFLDKWKEYMSRSVTLNDIENIWVPKYKKEDHPAVLMEQLNWLVDSGFTEADIIWKYYNFAVYGGKKLT